MAATTAGVARAQLTIEISRGVSEAVPIAVVPFGYDGRGEPPLDVASLVAADLNRSGRFAPIDRTDMISRPRTAWIATRSGSRCSTYSAAPSC